MPPRRLEAEAIRDAALAVSGLLNPALGGPSVRPPIDAAVLAGQSVPGRGWAVSKGDAIYRRSLYVHVKRTLPLPELEVLDAPSADEPCARRSVTTTAPQALTFLNSAFWHDMAHHFAERLRREAGDDPAAQVARAFLLAFQREATSNEMRNALAFLQSQAARIGKRPEPPAQPDAEALRAFCLVLLNANEFVTVD